MRKIFIVGLLTIFLVGCGSFLAPVPVINKSPARNIPDAYEVKQGDSIYKIAWAYGVDYLDIAKWTKIKEPYSLSPGQIVYLKKSTIAKITPLDADSHQLKEPFVAKRLPAKEPEKRSKSPPEESPSVIFSGTPAKWNWPAEGKLVGEYAPDKGSNGIQIAGTEGSPIKATAAGQVVYVGQGLRGYGQLIILKHSEEFLSAYAHNKKLLVEEGQAIKSGQRIAIMGSSGTQTTMLHFEIRKDGKPVDPMKYLK